MVLAVSARRSSTGSSGRRSPRRWSATTWTSYAAGARVGRLGGRARRPGRGYADPAHLGRRWQPDQDRFSYSPECDRVRCRQHPRHHRPARHSAARPGRWSAVFCSAGTSSSSRRPRSSSRPPSRPRSEPMRLPGRRARVGAVLPPVASRCPDHGSCPDRGDETTPGWLLHIGPSGSPFNRSKSAADTTEPAGQAGSRPPHADSRGRALTCAAPVKWRPPLALME